MKGGWSDGAKEVVLDFEVTGVGATEKLKSRRQKWGFWLGKQGVVTSR